MSSTTRYGNLILKLPEGVKVSRKVEKDEIITLLDHDGNIVVPEYAEVGLGYKKENGNYKVTSRVRSAVDQISTNLNVILSKYDQIYAIDTNRKRVDDIEYCVSCRMSVQLEQNDDKQWQMTLKRLPSLIFTNPTIHEEKIGWSQFVRQENLGNTSKRIGIVTDHELGEMPLYNLREKEILDIGFLPENVDFIYASGDRDKNSPLNNAVKQCDADSNLLLSKIRDGKMNLSMLKNSEAQYFDEFGYLVPKVQDN